MFRYSIACSFGSFVSVGLCMRAIVFIVWLMLERKALSRSALFGGTERILNEPHLSDEVPFNDISGIVTCVS